MARSKAEKLRRVDIMDALDGIPLGIAVLDSDFRVLGVNRFLEALTGYTTEDARGVYCEYILRSDLGRKGNPFRKVLETEEPVSIEGDIINQSRKRIPIQFVISPIRSNSGRVLGLVVALEDLSVLKNLGNKMHRLSGFEGIVGHSPNMQEVFELLPVISQTDASALITGETGTGKDMLGAAIHQASKRSRHPFVKVNCGALPESLLESELFGHARGAFTGADSDKPGMFRLAHGGTIYLTEIGDLPLPLQVKLLTVLDDKEFYPLGSSKKVKVDARVIAATHRDLREFVRQGKFREDLFFRLNVLRVHLPPLREREGDIRLLMDHFLNSFAASMRRSVKGFDGGVLEILSTYSYPGNVRELRNILEYAVTICQGRTIRPEHLPKYLLLSEMRVQSDEEPLQEEERQNAGSPPSMADRDTVSGAVGWHDIEKRMIVDALKKTGGRRARAAKLLGWGRSTLWRKIKQHGLL
jgi:two-component system response regulator AtoC